ncbi:hypothetical protein GCM10009560_78880 [Nonomuraea longicatena]|uniref:Uncharacterized protein n=1 Tax=Nonomuraea longicatena TaxID=83682 RepID=A0ABP4BTY1_9ACTN
MLNVERPARDPYGGDPDDFFGEPSNKSPVSIVEDLGDCAPGSPARVPVFGLGSSEAEASGDSQAEFCRLWSHCRAAAQQQPLVDRPKVGPEPLPEQGRHTLEYGRNGPPAEVAADQLSARAA